MVRKDTIEKIIFTKESAAVEGAVIWMAGGVISGSGSSRYKQDEEGNVKCVQQ